MARGLGRKPMALIFAAGSLLVAGLALWGVVTLTRSLDDELEAAHAEPVPMLQVVRARKDLPPGHTLQAEDLELVDISSDYVPELAATAVEPVVGRVALERILGGDILRIERLARAESGHGLNAIVPQGMRAISFNISGAEQVSGFVMPGNRIDVLTSLSDDDGVLVETRTLIQGVKVLAVDDRTLASQEARVKLKPQVTVAVAPEDAERLTHSFEVAQVRLTLRGDTDLDTFATRGAQTSDLLGQSTGHAFTIQQWYELAGVERLTVVHGEDVQVEELSAGGG